jgi:hypothetical protein
MAAWPSWAIFDQCQWLPHQQKLVSPSIRFSMLPARIENFFKFARELAGEQPDAPPGSKNVANWQTQFIFGRNSFPIEPLQRQLSLPTVANSPGKLANSTGRFVEAPPVRRHSRSVWDRYASKTCLVAI